METRLLRYFLAVAQEENITRAAQQLHITQPSLSRQLMLLEQELGKPLLVRGKRKVTLTEEGVLLRRRAEEILSLLEKTTQEIGSGSAALHGKITLGGRPVNSVVRTAAALRAQHPGVMFDFWIGDAIDIVEQLDHGSLDFAILLQPVDTLKYDFVPLPDTSHWGLLLNQDDPLTAAPAITPKVLRGLPLILHRRAGLQRDIARWAQTDPEQLNIAATYNVMTGSPIPLVQSGLGYFLTTRDHLAPDLGNQVCFRPLDPPLSIQYALVWKRHAVHSRPAQKFLDLLCQPTEAVI